MDVFRYAPVAKSVGGLLAVPIHIDEVTASIVFDAVAKTASCTAEMQFTVGPQAGCPIFDLRQTITSASLDGAPIATSALAHHDFGGGANTQLRVIAQSMAAGSSHSLALEYTLATPSSPNAQAIGFEAGSTRLSFDIFLSDLNPARYLEMWLPSNLLFDSFAVDLTIELLGSSHTHVLLANAPTTMLGANHWRVAFPAHFHCCSPMLIIEAEDRVEQLLTSTTLPNGSVIELALMKYGSDTSIVLSNVATNLGLYLSSFVGEVGDYMHGARFAAFVSNSLTRSMEYAGATTSLPTALGHEVFHSWWARGRIPAWGDDGWLDEAWTQYMTGGKGSVPFDMMADPVELFTNEPYRRSTPNASYSSGRSFFRGLAAELGTTALIDHMSAIYADQDDRRFHTPEIEAELIRRSGRLNLADFFARFVYGFTAPAAGTGPEVWMRDAVDDSGVEPYPGDFWLSPDVWVRNADDGGTSPQAPEYGQDNWLYARVHNRGNATAHSFVVGFKVQAWAGTEFVYPGDWFPLTAAAVGFDLAPGESRVVRARWRKQDIPTAGAHRCVLAVAYAPGSLPSAGAHVWDDNNLAQRNTTVVDLLPDEVGEINFWLGSPHLSELRIYDLVVRRPRSHPRLDVQLVHPRRGAIEELYDSLARFGPPREVEPRAQMEVIEPRAILLQLGEQHMTATLHPATGSRLVVHAGGRSSVLPRLRRAAAKLVELPGDRLGVRFDPGREAALTVALRPGERRNLTLRLRAPDAEPGEQFSVALVQRASNGRVVGGFTVRVRISKRGHRA